MKLDKYGRIKGGLCDEAHKERAGRERGTREYQENPNLNVKEISSWPGAAQVGYLRAQHLERDLKRKATTKELETVCINDAYGKSHEPEIYEQEKKDKRRYF